MEAEAGWAFRDFGLAAPRYPADVPTALAELGVRFEVTERILNHQTGALSGVAGVYNRFGYLSEMREALERWSAHVGGLAERAKLAGLIDVE